MVVVIPEASVKTAKIIIVEPPRQYGSDTRKLEKQEKTETVSDGGRGADGK